MTTPLATASPSANAEGTAGQCLTHESKAHQPCEACAKELESELTASRGATRNTLDAKAIRAYEHERQRAKRTAERQRAQGEKADRSARPQCDCCTTTIWPGSRGASGRSKRERERSLDRGGVEVVALDDGEHVTISIESSQTTGSLGRAQVMMDELVRHGKVRRSKGMFWFTLTSNPLTGLQLEILKSYLTSVLSLCWTTRRTDRTPMMHGNTCLEVTRSHRPRCRLTQRSWATPNEGI